MLAYVILGLVRGTTHEVQRPPTAERFLLSRTQSGGEIERTSQIHQLEVFQALHNERINQHMQNLATQMQMSQGIMMQVNQAMLSQTYQTLELVRLEQQAIWDGISASQGRESGSGLHNCPAVDLDPEELVFTNQSITGEKVNAVIRELEQQDHKKVSLFLEQNKINDTDLRGLVDSIQQGVQQRDIQVEYLDLSYNNITKHSVPQIIKLFELCPKMELRLCVNLVGKKDFEGYDISNFDITI